jgi:uncharacterized protein (TIGR03382 family)
MFVARRDHTATLLPDGRVLATGGANAANNPQATAEVYNPLTRVWSTSGGLTQARYQHTATLLPNGKVLVAGGNTPTSSTASANLYDVTTSTWSATGNMVQPRHLHTATLLPNGKVLVVGGLSTATPWAQAELYDPATSTWTAVGSLANARYEHTATLLPDGRVLVAGGRNASGALSSAEVYDPATNTWAMTGALPGPRTLHTATLLPSGKVLVVGGSNGSTGLSTTAEYTPTTGTWTLRADLAQARHGHSATLLPGGQVLVMAGQDALGDLASCVLYTPSTNTWEAAGTLSRTSTRHTTTLLAGGQILLVGGLQGSTPQASTEVYTAFTNLGSWSSTGGLTQIHAGHTATLLGNGRVLIVGGDGATSATATTEAYDFTTGTWASRASMVQARSLHAASLLQHGRVLVMGGILSSTRLATAELYDPATNAWAATGSLAQARTQHVATVLPNGRVLVTGGLASASQSLATAELYNPATGTWSSAGSMTTARDNHTATVLADGRVLVTGGYTPLGPTSSAEVYNPATGAWSSVNSMLSARYNHTATLLPTGEVLVTGGSNTGSLPQAELYNPVTGTWTSAGSMFVARTNHTATLLPGGQVLVIGGTTLNNDTELYNPFTGQWSHAGALPSGSAITGHTATLLPNGKVLLAGGSTQTSRTTAARLYSPNDALAVWTPFISSVSPGNAVPAGTAVTLSGQRFRGLSEAGGGTALSSATDAPLVTLHSLLDDSARPLLPSHFSGNSLTVTLPSGLTGPYLLFLTTNAVSTGQLFLLGNTIVPETFLGSVPPAQTNSRSATFTFSSSITGSTFECSLDGATFSTCVSPRTYNALTDGSHTVLVRAKDGMGSVDPTSSSHTWQVDATPPQTTLTSGPPAVTSDTHATFSFTADDAQATFECSLDGAAFAPCTSPTTHSALSNGSHTFQVRARDVLTNVDATPESTTWTVDTVAPDTSLTSTPPASTTETTASFSFTSTEAGATFECSLDGAAFAPCTSPRTLTGLGDGSHTFQVSAKDAAGNVDATPALHTWTVDTSTPETAITSGPPTVTSTTSATFTFTSNAAGATFMCSLDGATFSACTSPLSFTLLSDGTHVFLVRAKGLNGNSDPSPASFTWTVDTFAPNTFITSAPPELSTSSSATFSFSSDEGNVFYECSLDGASFSPCLNPTTYSSLSNTGHTFRVRAKDVAGNVDASPTSYAWTVDTSSPETLLSSAPPLSTQNKTASFTFSSNEASATFECSLDGVAFAACSSPTSYASLAEGSHTFQVRARRANGIVDPSPASHAWTVDSVVPDTTLTSAPPAASTSSSATFSFSSNEAGATFECSLDGAAFTACASPTTYSSLSNGGHTFQVRARDGANNVDATPASHTWTVDASAPETLLSSMPPALTSQKTASFTFSSPDTGVTFECSLDGAAFAACSSPTSYTSLAEGGHTFQVRARKANGNTDPSPASHAWTVDSVVPETNLTSAPPAVAASSSATFSFSSNEAGATFECSLDGAAFTSCTSPSTFTVAEGNHTFQVRARDSANNVDATPASHAWTVNAPPETSLTAAPPALVSSTNATFAFSSNEAGATFECSLDGAAFTACTSPRSHLALAEGGHTFQVRAKDAHSVDPTPASHTWTVDTVAPGTFLTSTPPAVATSPQASFSFSSDSSATFECSLDGTGFTACSSPYTSVALTDGPHTFSVRARDAAGNVDASPASFSWTVDAAAPDTTLTAKPAALTNATSATFAFTSNDSSATFECSLDGAAFTPCTSPVTYSALTAGSHIFVVRARDGSGQRDASPPSFLWAIDAVAPDTTLASGPPVLSTSSSASFAFASTESGATFECSLDGAAFMPCASPLPYASLPEGAHTFQVRARDSAGNVDVSPASHAWTVDTTAPTPPVLVEPARGATVTTAFPELSGTAEPGSTVSVSIDGNALGTVQADSAGNWLLAPPAPLAEGQHGVSLFAKDKAGNTSATATSTFTVKPAQQPEPEQPEPETPASCGCSSTAPLATWPWAALVLGLALSRRRGR